jgi:hypothetical protein
MASAMPTKTLTLARAARVLLVLVIGLLWGACRPTENSRNPDAPDRFPDHTVQRIEDVERFRKLAAGAEGSTEVLKFVITDFTQPKRRRTYFLDSNFYELHDEWYWFRLLNGARVPGTATKPHTGKKFKTPSDAAQWAKAQAHLPLDLRWVESERLYSDRFYELAIDETPRTLGVGSLVHLPAQSSPRPRPELWAFELQYRDPAGEHELEIFFEALESSLPAEIASKMVWIVRSPEQSRVATRLRERGRPLGSRVIEYAELALPGESAIYATGLTAGRLRSFTAGDPKLAQTRPTDILLLEALPDFLPPAAGVVTAVPQTPLAHVAILARNRGIPNVYLGGVLSDPNMQQLARVHAPVIVHATADKLEIHPIDEADYQHWRSMHRKPVRRVAGVDLRRQKYVIDLSRHGPRDAERLAPVIGGKATGFLYLGAARAVESPESPLAISIRAYAEHVAPLRTTISGMLRDKTFNESPKLRWIVLEGAKAYAKQFPTDADFASAFANDASRSEALREIVAAGGLRKIIRTRRVSKSTLRHIEGEIAKRFSHLSHTQGLRFRSSSTAEDIEGFTGAGLYTSSTGFLRPNEQNKKKDRKRSVEWALKRTWASYWSAEAFEERRLAGIDHLSANMGVLVHARFDDDKERANGVATLTINPKGGQTNITAEISVQAGALSVANPPGDRRVRPEHLLVTKRDGGAPQIRRLAKSTEVRGGRAVLEDEAALALVRQLESVASIWMSHAAQRLPPEQAPRGLVLDLEFRLVRPGWPAVQQGQPRPARMVIKQVRSLEPGMPDKPALRGMPIPREVLARASGIVRRTCRGGNLSVDLLEVTTDPLLAPDLGHGESPFVAAVELHGLFRFPELRQHRGPLAVSHLRLLGADHRGPGGERRHVRVRFADADALGFDALEIDPTGQVSLRRGAKTVAADRAQCAVNSELTTPDAYLLEVLRR